MIIPFTRAGFYYEAVETKEGWRILLRMQHGDQLFDSAVYPEDICKARVDRLNVDLIERRENRKEGRDG